MPRRQVWFFRFGAWTAVAFAVLHLAAHVLGVHLLAGEPWRQLMASAPQTPARLLGGAERTLVDVLDGFSLDFAVLLAALGSTALIVSRRASGDAVLMWHVARAAAVASVALLAVSMTKFFIIPTLIIAVMATCFLVASVEAPEGSE